MLTAEQITAAQRANVETLFGLTNKAFEGVEKLVELNLQVAKAAIGEAAETTRAALEKLAQEGKKVDLIAWSETMMPALNDEARQFLANTPEGPALSATRQAIADIAYDSGAAMIVGGVYASDWRERGEFVVPADRRNSAYFFDSTGMLSDTRYDKIHLVPFGEYVPFKESFPPLYQFFMWFSPYDFDYNLVPGADDALTVFSLSVMTGETTTQPAAAERRSSSRTRSLGSSGAG